MTLICPECGQDMVETEPDVHRCCCGFSAEQLTIGEEPDMEEPRPTIIDYLKDFPDGATHPEVVRFIENLLILLEHDYFAEPEYPEDTAWDNQ